jgi:bacillithiol system protein YtxJ
MRTPPGNGQYASFDKSRSSQAVRGGLLHSQSGKRLPEQLPTTIPMNWITLDSLAGLEDLVARSRKNCCLIFKHSTRCSISSLAKMRLESGWDFSENELLPYYLDLITFRALSDEIAQRFHVYHESPQILLIRNGACILDSSHLDIRVDEIREMVREADSSDV